MTTTILGIETSCDETAAAVVVRKADGQGHIVSNVVRSQIDAHAEFAGVVPEIAARAHVEVIDRVTESAIRQADISYSDLDAIAATAGPGLIGGVMVGLLTAKSLALSLGKPLLAINHLEAHVLTPRLTHGLKFPFLVLLASGGHTQWILAEDLGQYRRLASTIDDALGEAFDKTAKLLGLGFPGGPAVEKAARSGDPHRFNLPHPLKGRDTLDISLSGLKTALRTEAKALEPLTEQDVVDLCAAFEETVATIVEDRTRRAIEALATEQVQLTALVAAGGVAANMRIRAGLTECAKEAGLKVAIPPGHLCTDNGAMIAWAGLEHFAAGRFDPLDTPARARWPLDEISPTLLGSGKAGRKI